MYLNVYESQMKVKHCRLRRKNTYRYLAFRTFLSQKMSKSLRKVVIQGTYKMINLPFLFLFEKVSVPIFRER